jgi:toxin ParE1/3/4
MKLRWLSPALAQLDRIYEHMSQDSPAAARQVLVRIRRATLKLRSFPDSGRAGQVPGTRELVVTGLPYLIVYRVTSETVEILRVFHTSQERSDPFPFH